MGGLKTRILNEVVCMPNDANTNTATQDTTTLPSTSGLDVPLSASKAREKPSHICRNTKGITLSGCMPRVGSDGPKMKGTAIF